MTNACPDRYRNLTPRQECKLRSIRLHVDERPGRLPQISRDNVARPENEMRRLIAGALASGISTTGRIRSVVGGTHERVGIIIEAMRAERLVVRKKVGGRWVYVLTSGAVE